MTKYKLVAYFSYTFFPPSDKKLKKLIANEKLSKYITKFIKQLIHDHRNDLGHRISNPIKFHEVEILFKDYTRAPRNTYHVRLLIINKSKHILDFVETISDNCYKDLKITYPEFRVVPGKTRTKSARDIS